VVVANRGKLPALLNERSLTGESVEVGTQRASRKAAGQFGDGSLDFVYLDARHFRAAIEEDLELWAPKVCPGGCWPGTTTSTATFLQVGSRSRAPSTRGPRRGGLTVQYSGEHVWRSWLVWMP
jgi:hypothetical protein